MRLFINELLYVTVAKNTGICTKTVEIIQHVHIAHFLTTKGDARKNILQKYIDVEIA